MELASVPGSGVPVSSSSPQAGVLGGDDADEEQRDELPCHADRRAALAEGTAVNLTARSRALGTGTRRVDAILRVEVLAARGERSPGRRRAPAPP